MTWHGPRHQWLTALRLFDPGLSNYTLQNMSFTWINWRLQHFFFLILYSYLIQASFLALPQSPHIAGWLHVIYSLAIKRDKGKFTIHDGLNDLIMGNSSILIIYNYPCMLDFPSPSWNPGPSVFNIFSTHSTDWSRNVAKRALPSSCGSTLIQGWNHEPLRAARLRPSVTRMLVKGGAPPKVDRRLLGYIGLWSW